MCPPLGRVGQGGVQDVPRLDIYYTYSRHAYVIIFCCACMISCLLRCFCLLLAICYANPQPMLIFLFRVRRAYGRLAQVLSVTEGSQKHSRLLGNCRRSGDPSCPWIVNCSACVAVAPVRCSEMPGGGAEGTFCLSMACRR